MFAKLSLLALAASAFGQLIIQTPPSLVECQPVALSFSGGSAPYYLSVLPGGQSTAAPLLQFPVQNAAGTFTWVVNLPAGTSITLQVRDGTGALNYGSPVSILPGVDQSCLDTAAGSVAATAQTTNAPAGTTTATVPVTTQNGPSGLFGYSNSVLAALPASASYSQLGSAVFGVPQSYQVVESASGPSGPVYATGVLVNGPSAYVYSVAASGAASALAEYASCSVSGSQAVCGVSAPARTGGPAVQTTFTAPFATVTPGRRRVRLA